MITHQQVQQHSEAILRLLMEYDLKQKDLEPGDMMLIVAAVLHNMKKAAKDLAIRVGETCVS